MKTRSGEFDLGSIHSVSLVKEDISDLGCLGECTGLERLDLSYNNISRLLQLASLETLQVLNLSANRITNLEGLQSLNSLEKLNLAGNLIGGVDSLHCLSGLEKLTSLRLKDDTKGLTNPVCMNSNYFKHVTKMFPNLITLDGERIQGRGSEVFRMFREMDDGLAERSDLGEVGNQSVEPWVPDHYWLPSQKFEQSMLGDAQKQLEDLLSSCKRTCDQADGKLQNLQTTSK